MTGTELKLRRVAAHLLQKDIGQVAGWPVHKVSRIESRANVKPADVERYVAAVATLTTTTTDSPSAA